MTYYLAEYPQTDGKSGLRVFFALIFFFVEFTGIMWLGFRFQEHFLMIIGLGIPFSFLGIALFGELLSRMFFPQQQSDFLIELSAEKVVVCKSGVRDEIPNRNLVHGGEDPEDSKTFTITNGTKTLELPFCILPQKDKRQLFPRGKTLKLVVKNGVLMVTSQHFFRARYYHYDTF